MKLVNINSLKVPFPQFAGKHGWLIVLLAFSLNCFAQFHVSENTVFTVKENTILHITDSTSYKNVPNAVASKTKRVAKHHKTAKKIVQPPVNKKEADPENQTSQLSFVPTSQAPSALFYAGKKSEAALGQNTGFVAKALLPKKSYSSIFPLILLNYDEKQLKISFVDFQLPTKRYLEEHITRPPPFLAA